MGWRDAVPEQTGTCGEHDDLEEWGIGVRADVRWIHPQTNRGTPEILNLIEGAVVVVRIHPIIHPDTNVLEVNDTEMSDFHVWGKSEADLSLGPRVAIILYVSK